MNLPTPKTRTGWIFSLVLISLSFVIYYGVVFDILSTEYGDNFWETSTPLETRNINIDVTIPRYISRFAAREIIIRAKNITNTPQDGFSLIIAAGEITQNNVCVTRSKNTDMVFFCPSPNVNSIGCILGEDVEKYDGKISNIVVFDSIPPYGQVVRTVWVGGGQNEEGNNKVDFGFWEIPNQTLGTNETDDELKSESDTCLQFGSTSARFNPKGTFLQSFLRTLLLPPWSNGLIPALVFFVVYATEYKIQPDKNITKLPPFSLKAFFSDVKKWFRRDTSPRTFVVCCQICAFGLVALLYFGIAAVIVSVPLVFSHWIGGTDGIFLWLLRSIFGAILILISKYLLGKCEPTDDSMYQVEDVPVKPVKIDESVKNTLKRIEKDLNNNLSSSSQTLKKIEAGLSKLSVSNLPLVLTEQQRSGFSSQTSHSQEFLPELKVFSDKKNINTFLNWIKDFDISEVTKSLVLLEKFENDKQIQDKVEKLLKNVINKTVPSEFRRWLRDFSKPDKPIENFYVLNTLINLSARAPDLLAGSSLQLKEGEELQETPESVISNLLEPAALQHKDQKNIIKGLIKDFTKENEEAFKVFLQSLLDLYWTERCSANDILDFMSGRSYKDTNDFGVIFDSIKTHTADTVRFADLLKELKDNVEELALSEDLQNYFLGKLNSIK